MNLNRPNRPILTYLVSLSVVSILSPIIASAAAHAQGNPFQPPVATTHAPRSRSYHVRHMKLFFKIDAAHHSASGVVTHYLTPLNAGLAAVEIDAGANLTIQTCKVDGAQVPFRHEGERLTILPAAPLPKREFAVEIQYDMPASNGRGGGANGAGGFTWIDPRPGNPSRVPGFWTQGETDTNHKWVPCFDAPNDKCTSETHTTVPENWTVIGNGTELPVTVDGAAHTKTYHWVMKQPHSTYLLSLAGGEMDVQKAQWSGIPLYYAVPRGMGNLIPSSFSHTPDMLSFFSKRFGVKYPWPKYAQVCVFDFPGGMENVSATTLGVFLADARSSKSMVESLTSHELGHQWFGDLVTCSDWGDVWLNEGFATFCEMLYTEHVGGKDAYERDIARYKLDYLREEKRASRPLSTSLYRRGDDMFGQGLTYGRGGVVLHMLRRELGDKRFFAGLQSYLKQHAYQPVATSDFIKSMSQAAGRDLQPWFDQWVLKPGHPILEWSWNYDEVGKYTVLHLKQVQDTSDGTPVYSLPLRIASILPQQPGQTRSETRITTVTMNTADQEIRIPGAARPLTVLLDPEHDLLMETRTEESKGDALVAELKYAPSYQDRLRAVQKVTFANAGDVTALLAAQVTADPSEEVGAAMLNILADRKVEKLRTLYRDQLKSKQIRRRAAAINALAQLPKQEVDLESVKVIAASTVEPYAVVEPALRAVVRQDPEGSVAILQRQVEDERLSRVVIESIGSAKLEAGVPVLLKAIAQARTPQARRTAIRALGTLAPNDAAVTAALIGVMKTDSDPATQTLAIDTLKERKAVAALDALKAFAAETADSDLRQSANEAIQEITSR